MFFFFCREVKVELWAIFILFDFFMSVFYNFFYVFHLNFIYCLILTVIIWTDNQQLFWIMSSEIMSLLVLRLNSVIKLIDCNITGLTCFWEYHSYNFLLSFIDWVIVQSPIFVIFSKSELIVGRYGRWSHIARGQHALLDLEAGYRQQPDMVWQYSFRLVNAKKMTLKLDLNYNWFGMYFQRGNWFGWWRKVHIMTGFWRHKLAGVWTLKTQNTYANLIAVGRDITPYKRIITSQLTFVRIHK